MRTLGVSFFSPGRLVTSPGLSIHIRSPWGDSCMASESLAYDALRVFVNWQRERRLNKVRERKQAARTSTELLAAGGLSIVDGGQSLAIRVDGSIACWGDNICGQAPPDGVPGNFVAIAVRALHSLALRVDGSIACWGYNGDGRAPPDGIPGNFVAIAAGGEHSLALRVDGSIACWGYNGDGRAPPDGIPGDFVAIAAGAHHSLALRVDGSVACWGLNENGQAPPDGVSGPFRVTHADS